MDDTEREERETEAAGAEAAAIGGSTGEDLGDVDPADRPVVEGGGGEAEGFEQAEALLEENATHGDQHAARHVIGDGGSPEAESLGQTGGEADQAHSSEDVSSDR